MVLTDHVWVYLLGPDGPNRYDTIPPPAVVVWYVTCIPTPAVWVYMWVYRTWSWRTRFYMFFNLAIGIPTPHGVGIPMVIYLTGPDGPVRYMYVYLGPDGPRYTQPLFSVPTFVQVLTDLYKWVYLYWSWRTSTGMNRLVLTDQPVIQFEFISKWIYILYLVLTDQV